MSYKGSKSRVKDKKTYDETLEEIQKNSKNRKSKAKKVERKKTYLWGNVTRYHY